MRIDRRSKIHRPHLFIMRSPAGPRRCKRVRCEAMTHARVEAGLADTREETVGGKTDGSHRQTRRRRRQAQLIMMRASQRRAPNRRNARLLGTSKRTHPK
jgi:hypothetical protein